MQTLKNTYFFLNSASIFLLFLPFFSFLHKKCWKSIFQPAFWGVQHPDTGRNIQQRTQSLFRIMIFNFGMLRVRSWVSGVQSWDLPCVRYSDTYCTTSLFHRVSPLLLLKLVYTFVLYYLEFNSNYFQTDLAYQYLRLLCCGLCDVRYTRRNFFLQAFSTAVRVQFCHFVFKDYICC